MSQLPQDESTHIYVSAFSDALVQNWTVKALVLFLVFVLHFCLIVLILVMRFIVNVILVKCWTRLYICTTDEVYMCLCCVFYG